MLPNVEDMQKMVNQQAAADAKALAALKPPTQCVMWPTQEVVLATGACCGDGLSGEPSHLVLGATHVEVSSTDCCKSEAVTAVPYHRVGAMEVGDSWAFNIFECALSRSVALSAGIRGPSANVMVIPSWLQPVGNGLQQGFRFVGGVAAVAGAAEELRRRVEATPGHLVARPAPTQSHMSDERPTSKERKNSISTERVLRIGLDHEKDVEGLERKRAKTAVHNVHKTSTSKSLDHGLAHRIGRKAPSAEYDSVEISNPECCIPLLEGSCNPLSCEFYRTRKRILLLEDVVSMRYLARCGVQHLKFSGADAEFYSFCGACGDLEIAYEVVKTELGPRSVFASDYESEKDGEGFGLAMINLPAGERVYLVSPCASHFSVLVEDATLELEQSSCGRVEKSVLANHHARAVQKHMSHCLGCGPCWASLHVDEASGDFSRAIQVGGWHTQEIASLFSEMKTRTAPPLQIDWERLVAANRRTVGWMPIVAAADGVLPAGSGTSPAISVPRPAGARGDPSPLGSTEVKGKKLGWAFLFSGDGADPEDSEVAPNSEVMVNKTKSQQRSHFEKGGYPLMPPPIGGARAAEEIRNIESFMNEA
ncbi:unnamed protein product [Amoebophrya sp. A25]|nr:unnamed protein product [Amoebophrya sp. A25]|eukprot:GSA25T00015276001.1